MAKIPQTYSNGSLFTKMYNSIVHNIFLSRQLVASTKPDPEKI